MWGKMKYKVEDFREDMRSTGAGVGSDAKAWVTSLKTTLKVGSSLLNISPLYLKAPCLAFLYYI